MQRLRHRCQAAPSVSRCEQGRYVVCALLVSIVAVPRVSDIGCENPAVACTWIVRLPEGTVDSMRRKAALRDDKTLMDVHQSPPALLTETDDGEYRASHPATTLRKSAVWCEHRQVLRSSTHRQTLPA